MTRRILLAAACAALCAPARAQDPLSPGLHEQVPSGTDPAERYALYLPPGWTPAARGPVLLLADPAGRALVPMEAFREGAGRLGWVVMSAWGSQANTDSAAAATERALNAMIGDARTRWGADERRLYLAGFSGTARMLWLVAAGNPRWLGGLLVFGAGLPGPELVWRIRLGEVNRFPVFAGAGDEDFNHDEIVGLGGLLPELGFPVRTDFYPAGHAWPPPEVASRALEWLGLHAARDRGGQPGTPWVDSLYQARLAEAELHAAGDPGGAARELRNAGTDFGGLRDTAGLAARAAALEADPRARRAAALEAETRAADHDFRRALQEWVARADSLPPRRLHADAERTLRVRRLQAMAADSGEPIRMMSARRRLALLQVVAGFTAPRSAAARGEHARAAAWLALAREVREDAATCAALARALTRAGDANAALEALACAVRRGGDPERLRADRVLAALAPQPAFEAALRGEPPR